MSDRLVGRRAPTIAAAVATVVVMADQITKQWAVNRLEAGPCTPETCIDVVGSLRFHLHFNPGASFSTGASFGRLIGVVAIVMTIVLLRMAAKSTDRWSPALFGAIAGGALGNLLDRIFRADDGILSGEVVDFIDLQWWPIFNVADMAIVGGIIAVIAAQWWLPDDEASAPDHEPTGETQSS